MKLYVVIPVMNCLELTKQAVDSIQSKCGIIIVDNASTDGTKEWARGLEGDVLTYGKVLHYVENSVPKSVAASWNQGTKIAFEDPECKYVAILNNDVFLHPKTLSNLMAFMDKTHYLMVTGDNIKDRMSIETLAKLELPVPYTDYDCWKIEGWRAEGPDFSCFMINRETIRVLGWFDENYKGAYCEDQDYHARCSMARAHIQKHHDQGIDPERVHFKRLSTAPYYHYASQTVAKNPDFRIVISMNHATNHNYYVRKFGDEHEAVMDGKGLEQPFGNASMNWRNW